MQQRRKLERCRLDFKTAACLLLPTCIKSVCKLAQFMQACCPLLEQQLYDNLSAHSV
jgi:hypothetical protein